MSEILYLNGRWLPREQACISVEDRGFLFADGVYEVVRYYNGRPLAMDAHVRRLRHSLSEVRMQWPDELPPVDRLSNELIRRNKLTDAAAYWQVTRGVAPRKHYFPSDTRPTVLLMAYPAGPLNLDGPVTELQAITRPDTRWAYCSIKSTALLPNVLDSQAAADAGCHEAILVQEDLVTEGTHRSVLIVEEGRLCTYPLDGRILDSITRRIVLDLARHAGYHVHEEPFTLERLYNADEVVAVGSTTEVASIVEVDERPIGTGQAGPVARHLLDLYARHVAAECELQPDSA